MPIAPPAVLTPVWNAITKASAMAVQAENPTVQTLSQEIVVTALRVNRDLVNGTITFSGNVRVLYGPTTILADRLIVTESKREATAVGTVTILDPEGKMTAESLTVRFEEGNEFASFDKLSGEIAGSKITSGKATLTKLEWNFEDLTATPCRNNTPLIAVSAGSLKVLPGKRGTVSRLAVRLLGVKLFSIPKYRFNLDRRVKGIAMPTVAYRQGEGLGINWGASVLLGPEIAGSASFSLYNKSYPSYGVEIAKSLVSENRSTALITPSDDLAERFTYSWFDTVEVRTPFNETEYFTEARSSYGLQSQWNRGTARNEGDRYSKAIDLSYERSGQMGPVLMFGQVRGQSIRRLGGPFVNRALVTAAVATPPISLGPKLSLMDRVEIARYAGGESFGWIRGSVGLVYQPNPLLSLGVFGVRGSNQGNGDFPIDALSYPDGVHFRADLNLGASKFRYLTKRDPRRGWYDQEFYFAQVIGCLEAFVISRKVPGDYKIGVKIRVDQFVDLLQRRKFDRSESPQKKVAIQ